MRVSRYCDQTRWFPYIDVFFGSIGEWMRASGLQEVMETIYAPNAVSHMMTVKAFARAMRAHLLIAAALFAILVSERLSCELPYNYIKIELTELPEEPWKLILLTPTYRI